MPTQINEKYRCKLCGNEVVIIKAGNGSLVCCGQEMEKIEKQEEQNEPIN